GQLGLPPAGTRWLSALTGITAAVGTLAYYLATHRSLLAVTAVITSLYPAGTILLARVLLGERLTAIRITGLCLAAASVSLIRSGQLGLPPAGTRWLSALTGITAAVGTLAYYLATHRSLLAVTAVITSLYPAGTILLARVLLGERLTAIRITGLCLAAASVSLI